MHVAYKNQSLITEAPGNEPHVKIKRPEKQNSLYTIAREKKFEKAALKKYADRIKAIQVYFPGCVPL
jgi:hypothetical protein